VSCRSQQRTLSPISDRTRSERPLGVGVAVGPAGSAWTARLGRRPDLLLPTLPRRATSDERAAASPRGCRTKPTDRKPSVARCQRRSQMPKRISCGDPAESVSGAPEAPVSTVSRECWCFATTALVCATASMPSGTLASRREAAPRRPRAPSPRPTCGVVITVALAHIDGVRKRLGLVKQ